ncbi:signal transduction histidine kinase [Streptomyces canus]|uniref:histidine kinase n=2 Tax=Streptomyces canus TaxID=58343 RepID=A0AAW8F7I0_9ACTN|nr:sensor histidine kinase [Streptomyces canus]MDQ0906064.1 signal transduction histidine kinase [Streptomyces canus]
MPSGVRAFAVAARAVPAPLQGVGMHGIDRDSHPMSDNLFRRRPRLGDTALPLGLFACSFPGSLVTLPGSGPAVAWWPGVLLTGLACVALLWRRNRPRATTAVAMACATVVSAFGYVLTVLLLGPLMTALYYLALRTDRRTANTFALASVVCLISAALMAGPGDEPLVLKLLGPAAWLLLPVALGTTTRLRGAYLEAVQIRAELAERTREEETRHRVTAERMRIARDLHDVVAHHLLLANIQAGTVSRLLPARPGEAGKIAVELATTTLSALRELKATVGLLRNDADRTTDSGRTSERTPGLAGLPELAASFRHAGLTVAVTTEGTVRLLSAGTDLTAYRIVQEALTNVTKHAAVDRAEVRLVYRADVLLVSVVNDGPAYADSPSPGGGYGLIGMRERARSAGGRIRTGRLVQGGFEVVVELPYHPDGHAKEAAV